MNSQKVKKIITNEEIENNLNTYYKSIRKENTNFSDYESFFNKLKDNRKSHNINEVYNFQEELSFEISSEEEKFEDYKNQLEIEGYILSLYKEHEKYAKKIFQLSNGYFIIHIIDIQDISSEIVTLKKNKNNSDNSIQIKTFKPMNVILVKNQDYSKVLLRLDINTSESFISEINENGQLYAIISEENCFYAIAFKKDGPEQKLYKTENICIYQILQKDKKKYIISCNKGIYDYEGSIFIKNLPKYLKEDNIIHNFGFKKGILIDKRYISFIDNSKEDDKGNIIFYDLFSRNKLDKFIKHKISLNEKAFCIIDLKQIIGNKKVLLCACKENNKSGVLLIKFSSGEFEKDKIMENFIEIENFNIQHICPLKCFSFEKEQYNIYDSNYIIIIGKSIGEIEIRLYELEGIESGFFPTIKWVKDLNIHKAKIFNEISFIIHSITKGNLIMGIINDKTKELNFKLDIND